MFIIDDLILMGYGATMLMGAGLGKVERDLGLTSTHVYENKHENKVAESKPATKNNFSNYVEMIKNRCIEASKIEDHYMRNLKISLIKDDIRRLEFRRDITSSERKLLLSLTEAV